jgi:hypothetical protein
VAVLCNPAGTPPQALRTQPALFTRQGVSTKEPLPLAAVHRAPEGALRAWEAQATTSVLRHTPVVQNALLALMTIAASLMIVARAVRGAKASPVAARLAPDVGMRRFVALAVPIIALATRITGRGASGPAWWAGGNGFTPAIVGHGFIEALGSKAGFLHRR